jgi:hypothetical protein
VLDFSVFKPRETGVEAIENQNEIVLVESPRQVGCNTAVIPIERPRDHNSANK